MSERIEFSVGRYNPNPSAIDFVCSRPEARKHFPPPKRQFELVIGNDEYITYIQDVKDGRTIIGRTEDKNHGRVIRHDLCAKHNIKEGDKLLMEVIVPFKKYRLTKAGI